MDILNRDLTGPLNSWAAGSEQKGEKASPLVDERLRYIASCHLRNEKADILLQATAMIVEMRYFAGLSLEEITDVLESPSTVSRKWRLARAFLYDQLQPAA